MRSTSRSLHCCALSGVLLLMGIGCSDDSKTEEPKPAAETHSKKPKAEPPEIVPPPDIPEPVEEPVEVAEEDFDVGENLPRAELEARLELAQETLRKLKRRNLQLDRVASKALLDLAIVHDMEGNPKGAIDAFERYLRLKPKSKAAAEIRENLESLRNEVEEAGQ